MTDPIDIRSRRPRTGPHSVSRIDTLDLQSPVRVVPGRVEQRQCSPGMCQSLPTCNDHACQGHPGTNTIAVRPPDEPSPLEREPSKTSMLLSSLLFAFVVFVLLAAVVAVMGPPQDH